MTSTFISHSLSIAFSQALDSFMFLEVTLGL